MPQSIDVGRYRSGVAGLLADVVSDTRELECTLSEEKPIQVLLKEVPDGHLSAPPNREDADSFLRLECAVFLHKARIHLNAVLRANEARSIHSLGVQMRPVMECAGQVVLLVGTLLVPPPAMGADEAFRKVDEYVGADLYRAAIGSTRGQLSKDAVLEMFQSVQEELAESAGIPRLESGGRRGLRQEDKVAMLPGGKAVYAYLSEHLCRGEAHGDDAALRDSVDVWTAEHELSCANLMLCLVEYAALMNAHASLCPVPGGTADARVDSAMERLSHIRETVAEIVSLIKEADLV